MPLFFYGGNPKIFNGVVANNAVEKSVGFRQIRVFRVPKTSAPLCASSVHLCATAGAATVRKP
jgi:hypothetical protein